MSAQVNTVQTIRYQVRCLECDLLIDRGSMRQYAQIQADRHNKYVHSDPPIHHTIACMLPKLIGYTAECICGYSTSSEYSVKDWACPLDKTLTERTSS